MKKQQNDLGCAEFMALVAVVLAFMGILGFQFGTLYILLLISLVFGMRSQKYRKFLGIVLGLVLLGFLFRSFLINQESVSLFLRSTRIISIVGLWLTSIGFIGKSRLEKWESSVKNLLQNRKSDSTAESVYQKQWGLMIGVLLLTIGALTACALVIARPLLSLVFSSLSIPPEREDEVLFGILAGSLILFFLFLFLWPFVGYALIIPFQIVLLPFRLAEALDKTAVAERGFIIVGLLMSTIGLVLNY